ncbi:MAG: divergent PAP2 family protein [Candidatus Aminicenantes bacterium]|jgi:acid phosphatase family membrane protein YuiD
MTKLILGIVVTWLIVNILKPLIKWKKAGKFEKRFLAEDGGMPSGHTSWVAPLATGMYLETGFSYYFIISVVITLNVVYDAISVRPKIGRQARTLNKLIAGREGFEELEESVGHTPLEVLASLALSVIIPLCIYKVF